MSALLNETIYKTPRMLRVEQPSTDTYRVQPLIGLGQSPSTIVSDVSAIKLVMFISSRLHNLQPDIGTPIPLCGDFNVDITHNKAKLEFIKKKLNLNCVIERIATLGKTGFDIKCARNFSAEPMTNIFLLLLQSSDCIINVIYNTTPTFIDLTRAMQEGHKR
jgi:hypothetical protein